MAATLKDIADRLKISTSTVSYALNGGPRPVPNEVREKVLQVAKELDYRGNWLARSLVTKRTGILGLVPSDETDRFDFQPYLQACFSGVVNAAEALGQDVMVFTRGGKTDHRVVLQKLLDNRVDGLIFVAPYSDSPMRAAVAERGVPHVVISGTTTDRWPTVRCDNHHGVKLALDHLQELGHERIGHIHGRLAMSDGAERLEAFQEEMRARGLALREDWVKSGDFTPQGGYQASFDILSLKDRPTALVCANDASAVGVYQACQELGLRIPSDLSVVGYDGFEGSGWMDPKLTTVHQPLLQLGSLAVQALFRVIEGRGATAEKLYPALTVRQSTTHPTKDLSP